MATTTVETRPSKNAVHNQKTEKYITTGRTAVRSAETSHHEPKKTSTTGTGCGSRSAVVVDQKRLN